MRREQAAAHGRRFVRFGLVGLTGVIVNFVVLTALAEAAGLHYLIATALATEAAILTNFTLNDRWTFRDVQVHSHWIQRAWKYNLFALGGLMISVVVMAVLTSLFSLHYLFANVFAIGAAMFWNYATNARWTWSTRAAPQPVVSIESVRNDGSP